VDHRWLRNLNSSFLDHCLKITGFWNQGGTPVVGGAISKGKGMRDLSCIWREGARDVWSSKCTLFVQASGLPE